MTSAGASTSPPADRLSGPAASGLTSTDDFLVLVGVGHGADARRIAPALRLARTLLTWWVVEARAACFVAATPLLAPGSVTEPADGPFAVPAGAVPTLPDGEGDGFEVCDGVGDGEGPLVCVGLVEDGDGDGDSVIVGRELGLAGQVGFEFRPLDDEIGEVAVLDPVLLFAWPGPARPGRWCGPVECSVDDIGTSGEIT